MDSSETRLTSFGECVQQALEAETQPQVQLRAGRTRLLERVTSGASRARPRTGVRVIRIVALPALAAAAVAVNLLWLRPISFVVGDSVRDLGDALQASRERALRVDFSEGSRMLLHKGSRARVVATQAAGARVLLESGRADVAIVHRLGRGTRWRFDVGPFQVHVKGTQFALDWQPDDQALSLTMRSGRVEVTGPCLTAPQSAVRGQVLHFTCAKKRLRRTANARVGIAALGPLSTPAAADSSSEVSALAGPDSGSEVSAFAAADSGSGPAPSSSGRAMPSSFEALCESASLPQLVARSNRERLLGHLARARTALLVLRRRFVGSPEAGTAAFTLGRMAFERRGDYREAARWFEVYLAEQPAGPLMGDAAGRLLEARERQGDRERTRRQAQSYLKRFPDGPYAPRARRILAK